MHVTGVSDLSSCLIHLATAMNGRQVHREIQVAVLKQALDQQEAAGEALVRLIRSSPNQDKTASRVDIRI